MPWLLSVLRNCESCCSQLRPQVLICWLRSAAWHSQHPALRVCRLLSTVSAPFGLSHNRTHCSMCCGSLKFHTAGYGNVCCARWLSAQLTCCCNTGFRRQMAVACHVLDVTRWLFHWTCSAVCVCVCVASFLADCCDLGTHAGSHLFKTGAQVYPVLVDS